MSYSGGGIVILGLHCVAFQAVVNSGHERVLTTVGSSKVVHVDSPDHGTEVFFLLDKVHLVNDAVSVFVTNPLSF